MSCVRPGVLLVLANCLLFTITLIALDLPEFDRPAKATSVPSSQTNCLVSFALRINLAFGYCDMTV